MVIRQPMLQFPDRQMSNQRAIGPATQEKTIQSFFCGHHSHLAGMLHEAQIGSLAFDLSVLLPRIVLNAAACWNGRFGEAANAAF
ncbi:hypothetical protein [Marinovum algicola]|uniref:hypothetical protein n=1 Tax=Marinovum algicola TaxID=42444 RepID=UPI000941CDDA|nr:hypothetical protein [Marinovum algicola]